jgi:hypothetical protein
MGRGTKALKLAPALILLDADLFGTELGLAPGGKRGLHEGKLTYPVAAVSQGQPLHRSR